MTTTDTQRAAAYAGWRRIRGGGWTKLTEQSTERECWRVLLEITSELPGGGDSMVLPVDQHPNQRTRRPR